MIHLITKELQLTGGSIALVTATLASEGAAPTPGLADVIFIGTFAADICAAMDARLETKQGGSPDTVVTDVRHARPA